MSIYKEVLINGVLKTGGLIFATSVCAVVILDFIFLIIQPNHQVFRGLSLIFKYIGFFLPLCLIGGGLVTLAAFIHRYFNPLDK